MYIARSYTYLEINILRRLYLSHPKALAVNQYIALRISFNHHMTDLNNK